MSLNGVRGNSRGFSRASSLGLGLTQDEMTAIMQTQFPDFLCVCEICDCGRHKHHKDCKKAQRPKGWSDKHCNLTHYERTFTPHVGARPPHPLRPPPTARDPNPGPMYLITSNRTDYVPQSMSGRGKLIKQEESYEPSSAPFEKITVYKDTYPGHTSFPDVNYVRPSTQSRRKTSAKFDPRTAHKDYFKPWVPQPAIAFGELPSFTGSILYPGTKLGELQSMTQKDFPGYSAPKPEPAKMAGGNIQLEGDFDHVTTHKDTFKDMGPGHKAERIRHREGMRHPDRTVRLDGVTQHMRDFPGYKSQPLPPKAVTPAPATIRLSMDSRLNFETEQRKEFQGIDTKKHPRMALMKKEPDKYEPPTVKFETMTSNKVDYRPIDLEKAYQTPRINPEYSATREPGDFDDKTMHKKFFQDWGVQPRIRYGDFHEANIYIPPKGDMRKTSTNTETFTAKQAEPVKNYKPDDKPMVREGKQDFTTVHKETYTSLKLPMCPSQAYLLQQEIRKRRKLKLSKQEKSLETLEATA
ncbi:stabilizer of axonemal microtubules 1-like [Ptychodera flava]|uniref:stabilizer of axonemal microtubules 1-like n=1 Tax=Ptychodera flava TaxID=63121 RepID=UPI00396A88F2